MERTAALALTSRLEANFGQNPRWSTALVREWTDALETLDEGAAGTTFVRFRNAGKPSVTIPEFIAACRALNTVDAGNRAAPCGDCDGTGWVEAPDRIWENDRHSTQVKPCRCAEGRQRAGSRVWTEHNPMSREDAA